jgi:hypothetical protein
MARKHKQKEPEYNWFGTTSKSSKTKYKSISFLGLGKASKRNPIKRDVSFLGKSNPNLKMTPSTLFRKENIKKRKKLSRYGDADMDGTPNYLDCDPTNWMKDAKKGPKLRDVLKKTFEDIRNPPGSESRMNREISKELDTARHNIFEERKALRQKKQYANKEEMTMLNKQEKGLNKEAKFLAKQEGAEKLFKKYSEASKISGPAGSVAMKGAAIEEKRRSGGKVSQKQILAYEKALKKTKMFGKEGTAVRGLKAIAPGVESALGAVTGYGLGPKGTYTQEMRVKSARIKRMTQVAVGQLFGPALTARGFDSEPRARGRPSGPSGEYKIGGKPVYEEEYRQWEAKQNAMNRMLPSEVQSASLTPEYIEYMKAQEEKKRQEATIKALSQQQNQISTKGVPSTPQYEGQEQMSMAEDNEMDNMTEDVPSDQAPITEGMTSEQAQAISEMRRSYTRSSPDEIRQAQYAAEQKDNILSAPNFMKGELKAAGGSILTPNGPQIMDAPNAFKGELRNVTQGEDRPTVTLSERPQTNPYGDEYLEIELGSGKPVIRKRPREKWMTGEAL